MENIGSKLKSLRKEYGYSIKNIVLKLNEINIFVTEQTVYRWENNTVIPDIKIINVLSHIYNVNIITAYEESKFYKSLTTSENKFINLLRKNEKFKKVITLISKL